MEIIQIEFLKTSLYLSVEVSKDGFWKFYLKHCNQQVRAEWICSVCQRVGVSHINRCNHFLITAL